MLAVLQPVAITDCVPAVTALRSDGRCNCSNNTGFRAKALFAAYVMMGCQTPGAEVPCCRTDERGLSWRRTEVLGRAEIFSPTPYPLGSPERRFLKALAP